MNLLEARGIRKRFGGVEALSNGNLSASPGRITGLLGANGSGKSTMSKIIAGVYSADAGEIEYDGRLVHYSNPHEARAAGIAMVYQNLSLAANLTVWQNIVLGAEEKGILFLDDRRARERSRRIVDELLPGLDVERTVDDLSPGEMQIVEIAKAMWKQPRLLILDEPTAALELAQVKGLFAHMRSLAEQGIAVVFTSHRLWEVMEICDDTVVFRNGENVANLDLNKDGRDPAKIIGYITGEAAPTATVSSRRAGPASRAVLSVRNLGYRTTLRNVSFDLNEGEILGVGGLAGQGQRELLLALAGFYPDVSGVVELDGRALRLSQPANAVRANILLVPGDRESEGLFLRHSIFANVVFPRLGMRHHPLFTPRGRYRQDCQRTVDTLSIRTSGLDMPVRTLSGGNQQKVVVGKWLGFDTRVLLLSDPAKGVDVGAKRDLYEYITRRVRDDRMSVILYASDNEELVSFCDRVMIMYEGQLVATLEGDSISAEKIIESSMHVEKRQEESPVGAGTDDGDRT
ncbi:MAG TPA: sugar ABC transporter ATP-binding protein [Candidatus Sulfotelmatobacter sp.]|nr:sugar ABC transporter ATP-binding protein [Candidatus Sulfotelmatobacter sp.]